MTQSGKRFFIGAVAVPAKKKGQKVNLLLCLLDLKTELFFYPASAKDMASAVRELCSRHDFFEDHQAVEPEVVEEVAIRTVQSEMPDDLDSIALIDDEAAERGIDDLVSESFEQQFVYHLRRLRNHRVWPDIDLAEEEAEELRPVSKAVVRPKNLEEIRGEERLAHPFYQNPIFEFERDFTYLLEDVPAHIRAEHSLLSLQTVSDQYNALRGAIDIALHPDPRSRGLTGMVGTGSPDLDTAFAETAAPYQGATGIQR